jgi:DNA-binding GntR family transcriptional regulator
VGAGLRRALIRGDLLPEQTLSIRAIAEAYGVSAMPVREALSRLQAEDAVIVMPNRVMRLPALTRDALAEITDMRLALEGMAAARAATLATDAERAEIAEILHDLDAAAQACAINDYLDQNARFHFAIYRAARRARLMRAIESLWLRVGPSIRLCMPDKAHLGASMAWHRRAAAAMLARDAPAARAAIEGDIAAAAASMDRSLAAGDTNRSLAAGDTNRSLANADPNRSTTAADTDRSLAADDPQESPE